jgi:hypothetical protein
MIKVRLDNGNTDMWFAREEPPDRYFIEASVSEGFLTIRQGEYCIPLGVNAILCVYAPGAWKDWRVQGKVENE